MDQGNFIDYSVRIKLCLSIFPGFVGDPRFIEPRPFTDKENRVLHGRRAGWGSSSLCSPPLSTHLCSSWSGCVLTARLPAPHWVQRAALTHWEACREGPALRRHHAQTQGELLGEGTALNYYYLEEWPGQEKSLAVSV